MKLIFRIYFLELAIRSLHMSRVFTFSMKVRPDLVKFRNFDKILKEVGQLLKAFFTIGQSFEPTLANILWQWANLHSYIEKII